MPLKDNFTDYWECVVCEQAVHNDQVVMRNISPGKYGVGEPWCRDCAAKEVTT